MRDLIVRIEEVEGGLLSHIEVAAVKIADTTLTNLVSPFCSKINVC